MRGNCLCRRASHDPVDLPRRRSRCPNEIIDVDVLTYIRGTGSALRAAQGGVNLLIDVCRVRVRDLDDVALVRAGIRLVAGIGVVDRRGTCRWKEAWESAKIRAGFRGDFLT